MLQTIPEHPWWTQEELASVRKEANTFERVLAACADAETRAILQGKPLRILRALVLPTIILEDTALLNLLQSPQSSHLSVEDQWPRVMQRT